MASTHKHLRSSTANKRPTTAIADGQIALNTNTTSPGLFFKDSTGATIIKVGPVHVGTTAPNATPPAGGSSGNSTGEIWLDTSLTPNGVKIWNGSAWVNATPIGTTSVQGLLELATSAETQTGTDTDRAVTPAGLQSKVSDSTSTTSSTTIASSTAVKSAYDLANAALPKSGGTVTGNLEIGSTGSLSFEGATVDAFETTIAVVDPTADRTITLPDTTGTIVTTGDTGTVTSTMIADGTILNADINASAAIAGTKISPDFGSQTIATTGIVSHALGTAVAPTVTFTGDTNTGIYSPGADQVAISTGGTGRLFVDSSGQVGVGTNSPSNTIHIVDSSSTANGTIRIGGGTGFNGYYATIQQDAVTTGKLLFNTVAAAGSVHGHQFQVDGTAALTINASRRVGIGTTSPSSLLHLEGSDGVAQIRLQRAGTNIYGIIRQTSAPYGLTYDAVDVNTGSPAHAFRTSTDGSTFSERARIDSSGRLLVGTSSTSIACRQVLEGSSGTQAGIQILAANTSSPTDGTGLGAVYFGDNTHASGTGVGAIIIARRDGGTWSASSNPTRIEFSTCANGAASATERFRIFSDGNARFANLTDVYPATDNAVRLGASGIRWSQVWAANGTIQTSDQRAKVDINTSTLGLDFIKSLRPVSYKWIEGGKVDTGERDEDGNYIYESVPGERTHWGFIAQEVKQAVDAAGVDFGGWVLTDKDDPDSQQALRYDQFIAPLTKALQEALAEIDVLKAKVAALESA